MARFATDGKRLIEQVTTVRESLVREVSKVIVGQEDVVELLLIALLSRGHVLLEGVPGLAKTLLVATLARTMNLSFRRIQFTPDLMPADITGIDVMEESRETGHRQWRFLEGPVFANLVLADEINRTAPRTQSALLEAMQEQSVTAGRVSHALPDPFFVLATQNPIEQEGTYPLPEAQQDRFLFKVLVPYPRYEDEREIAKRSSRPDLNRVESILTADDLIELTQLVEQVPCADHIVDYAVRLVRATREGSERPDALAELIQWGAGPRAVQSLIRAGRAHALLTGKTCVHASDITAMAHPVLRHRLVPSFLAQSDNISPDRIIDKLLQTVAPQATDSGHKTPRK
ncbi:MAG: MoxR family ATPase [Planctomycetia bacterium]|nr:MoxR family ATPase [Planctomycetia bacterium]